MNHKMLTPILVATATTFSAVAAENVTLNLKDAKAQTHAVHYNNFYKAAFGGGDNVRNYVSQEFYDIFRDDKFKHGDLPLIAEAVMFDKGWSNNHGVDGVTLYGLSNNSITLGFTNGDSGVDDTILFYGTDVTYMLESFAVSNIDTKDNKSRLAIFDVQTPKDSMFIGGGAKWVSEEFKTIVGGSSISADEVQILLSALLEGKSDLGVANVQLIGLEENNFAVAIKEGNSRYERVLFRGEVVEEAIQALSLPRLDTGDGWSKIGVWNTDQLSSLAA